MKLKKITLAGLVLFLGTQLSFSQTNDSSKPSPYLGVQIGTFGAGLQYVYPLNSRWDLRASATYIQLSYDRTVVSNFQNSVLTTSETIQGRTGGLGIFADYNLSSKTPNWKLAFGAVYQINRLTDTRMYDVLFEGEHYDLGTLTLEFKTFPINPYAGLVWGNFKSDKKVTVALEAGTLYHGAPRVDFTGTGRIAPTAEQDDIVKSNVKNYSWFPYFNFQVNYKLGGSK